MPRDFNGGVRSFYAALGVELPNGHGRWVAVRCFSPDHDHDRNPSCGVNLDHGGFKCQACEAHGGAYDAAILLGPQSHDAAELCKRYGLGHWDDDPRGGGGSQGVDQPHNCTTGGCTIEQYAKRKRLGVDFLRAIGVSDYTDGRWPGVRVLRIPYRDVDGNEPAVRIRHSLDKPAAGGDRFLWRKGSRPCLYGLDRVDEARRASYVVLVEGESDCHTLWAHDLPALGLPGANGWNEGRDAQHLVGIDRIYVVIEPDTGGDAVLGWLARSSIRDRVWLVELHGCTVARGGHTPSPPGDASELHVAGPDRFRERFQAALDDAEPWRSRAADLETAERREAWLACERLARTPRILDALADDAARAGVTGERKTVQLTYLVATSRLLDRLASLVVKGQSSSGKSWVVQTVLRFFPESACYALTAASEHALIYDREPLAHRVLVVYEASGLNSDKFSYIVRSLISEGRLRYPTVVKRDGELVTVMIEREGPTALITTTAAHRLHAENETRLLSAASDDSADQTSAVLLALADERRDPPDFAAWHALQRWLELGGREVTIPYAETLARLIPPAAVRLRRDFGSLLALIRGHALLHQATRNRDDRGRIIAELDDYDVVRVLLADIVSEAVEKTVKPELREIVNAVAEHGDAVTQADLVRQLELDKGTVSRRVRGALDAGYLVNQEERRGRAHRLVLGNPLPDDVQVLPPVEALHNPHGAEPSGTLPARQAADGLDVRRRCGDLCLAEPGRRCWYCGAASPA